MGVVCQHALQASRPTPRGEVEGSGWGEGVSRPTPKGEVEGSGWEGGLQAHTGRKLRGLGGGGSPGPHPGGKLRGLARGVSKPTPGGYRSMPCRSPGPHPEGRLRGLQAHPQWGKLRGLAGGGLHTHTRGSSGPYPGGVYPSMH